MKLSSYSLSLFVVVGSICASFAAADDNCAAAVDAADSMNVNQKECDYTKEGLNGALHKAFKRGSEGEGAVLNAPAEKSLPAAKSESVLAAKKINKAVVNATHFSLSVEVDQWPSVALARVQLLPKAMEKCPKGFAIQGEQYRPLAMGRIELSVAFSCLE
jgi:hypothetical protein